MTTWRHSEPASRTLRKANSLMMLPMSCSRCLSFCQVAQTRRNFRGTLRLSATCGNFPMHQLRCRSQHGARDKSYSARLRRRARHGSLSYPHRTPVASLAAIAHIWPLSAFQALGKVEREEGCLVAENKAKWAGGRRKLRAMNSPQTSCPRSLLAHSVFTIAPPSTTRQAPVM
jgi:hypothetical protein